VSSIPQPSILFCSRRRKASRHTSRRRAITLCLFVQPTPCISFCSITRRGPTPRPHAPHLTLTPPPALTPDLTLPGYNLMSITYVHLSLLLPYAALVRGTPVGHAPHAAPPYFNSKTLHLIVTSCSGRPGCGAEAAPFAPNIHLSLLLPYAALVRGTPVGHAPHAAPPLFKESAITQRIAQHLPCHCSCIPPAQGALAVVLRRHLLHPTSTSPCFCHTLLSCAARRLVTPLTPRTLKTII
jgi:hypothetical protein